MIDHDYPVRSAKLDAIRQSIHDKLNAVGSSFEASVTYDGTVFIYHTVEDKKHSILLRFPKPDYRKAVDTETIANNICTLASKRFYQEATEPGYRYEMRLSARHAYEALTASLNA
jgi:hypothetical protein